MINKINNSTSFRGESFITFNDGLVNTEHLVSCDYDHYSKEFAMQYTNNRKTIFKNVEDPKKYIDVLTNALEKTGNKVFYIG